MPTQTCEGIITRQTASTNTKCIICISFKNVIFIYCNIPNFIFYRKATGICSTWDQHHYHTFDGRSYNYLGTCSYALAIDCRAGSDDFAIHVENDEKCHAHSDISCKRSILLFVNDIEYRISSVGNITIDGKADIELPYLNNGVSISKHAKYTFLEAWEGKV